MLSVYKRTGSSLRDARGMYSLHLLHVHQAPLLIFTMHDTRLFSISWGPKRVCYQSLARLKLSWRGIDEIQSSEQGYITEADAFVFFLFQTTLT